MKYNDVERFFGLNTREMTNPELNASWWRRALFCLVCIAVGVSLPLVFQRSEPKPARPHPCDALKAFVDAKIKARGVQYFSLDVVDSRDNHIGRVVGVCDGGTKKIIYRRLREPAQM